MNLAPGTRIGAYEIVALIGAGGMGEVYRARDAQLQRDVAIKVLPELFVRDPERLARFDREARTLAALNHPHVAQVYGVVDVPGTGSHALILEFVDGEDLAERIRRAGALPIDEALPIALQIAEALEAAHDQHIIHRDLKPANVKVRPDGQVKVLDFGLAKALDSRPEGLRYEDGVAQGLSPAQSPTITSPFQLSQLGVILGTAAYMAPEQAKGKAVDKRADIWAFGCVLFEMLTGRRPFGGEDVTDTLAAIVRGDPDWTALPAGTPPTIRGLLARCLVKDAKRRLRDVGDARIAIEEAIAHSGEGAPGPATAGARRGLSPAWLAAAIPVAVAAAVAAWLLKPVPSPVLRKFQLSTEGLQSGLSVAPVISPDGASLAYVAGGRLMVRPLDQMTPRELAAPADGLVESVFWSPDGAWVGYGSGKKLWKVSATGGGSAAICGVPESGRLLGATWGADDTVVFSAWRGSMYRVSALGGTPVLLLAMNPSTEIDFHDPRFLPDGRRLTFIPHAKFGPIHQIESLTNGARAVVFDVGSDTLNDSNYSQGHLLFTRSGGNSGIWALPFDLAGLKGTGDPFLVAAGGVSASVAADGTLLYVAVSAGNDLDQLAWLDRTGRVTEPIGDPRMAMSGPTLSPDGRRVAFSAQENDNVDVWIHDLTRGGATRVTSSSESEDEPAWSPRGESLVYVRGPRRNPGESHIFMRNIDEGTPERDLGEGRMPSFSPDGRLLVFTNQRAGNGAIGLRRVPDGGGPPTPAEWTPGSNNERGAEVSPDGRLLAYMSAESGRTEVYLRGFPDGRGRWLVSTEGGREPRWAGKSGELFYIGGTGGADRSMMVAGVTHTGNAVTVGKPVTLYKDPEIFFRTIAPGFDVSPDGQRILTVKRAQSKDSRGRAEDATPRMIVVQNWLSEFAGKR